jgi:molybdopterin-biosynthesis enzyme MoeA-like protein
MQRTFGALIIGDEILSGKRQDKHLSKLIEILSQHGLSLSYAHYLGDDPALIASTLKQTLATNHIVFSFGGIGATPDDYTRQSAAAALGVALYRHPDAVAEIEARFGADAYPKRVLMAEFPIGSTIIPNSFNRIAAFSCGDHHFLPGFPEMAWPMIAWVLETKYADLFHQMPFAEEIILIERAGESDLLDVMNYIVKNFPTIKLSSLPQFLATAAGGRMIELSIRGDPLAVPMAMAELKQQIHNLGFDLRVK